MTTRDRQGTGRLAASSRRNSPVASPSVVEVVLTRWLARGEGVLRCCVPNSSSSAGSLDGSGWFFQAKQEQPKQRDGRVDSGREVETGNQFGTSIDRPEASPRRSSGVIAPASGHRVRSSFDIRRIRWLVLIRCRCRASIRPRLRARSLTPAETRRCGRRPESVSRCVR
jgi:hypothetical protein